MGCLMPDVLPYPPAKTEPGNRVQNRARRANPNPSSRKQSWTSPLTFGRDAGKPREKSGAQVEDVSVINHHWVFTRGPPRGSAAIPMVVPPLKLSIPAPPRSPPRADAIAPETSR